MKNNDTAIESHFRTFATSYYTTEQELTNPVFIPDHHKGVICCVAFDRSFPAAYYSYASVVAPRRLASNAFMMVRNRGIFNKLTISCQILNGLVDLGRLPMRSLFVLLPGLSW
jgi:hypothetical protein